MTLLIKILPTGVRSSAGTMIYVFTANWGAGEWACSTFAFRVHIDLRYGLGLVWVGLLA